MQARGKKAAVLVQFLSADKDLHIQFPLQAEKGEWKIQNNISTSTTIDFIPAQKPDNGS